MHSPRLLPAIAVLLAWCSIGTAQTWIRDPIFAPELRNDSSALTYLEFVEADDGRVLVHGPLTHINDGAIASPGLAYLRADGTADPSFQSQLNPRAGWIRAAAPLAGGRTLVLESLLNGNYQLSRLLANGSTDPTFTPLAASPAVVLTRMPDGSVIAWQGWVSTNGASLKTLVRFTATGDLDAGFAPPSNISAITAIAAQSDGRIVISGSMPPQILGPVTPTLFRLNRDGSLDTTFAAAELSKQFRLLAVQPDGKIVGAVETTLSRYDSSGVPDSTFAPAIPSLKLIEKIEVQRDGLAVQCQTGTVAPYPSTVVLLSNTGAIRRDLRTNFGSDRTLELASVLPNDELLVIQGLAIRSPGTFLPDGVISVFPEITPVESTAIMPPMPPYVYAARPTLERVSADGTQATRVNSGLISRVAGQISKSATDASGRLFLQGMFTHVDNQPREGLARFGLSGELDGRYQLPEGTWASDLTLVGPDGSSLVRISEFRLDTSDRLYRLADRMVRFRADGTLDPTFASDDAFSAPRIRWHALHPDGRVLIAYFTPDDTKAENFRLGWLSSDGKVVTALPTQIPGAGPLMRGIVLTQTSPSPAETAEPDVSYASPLNFATLLPDGKILIGGSFKQVDGVDRPYVARLLPSGALDTTYVPDLSLFTGAVYADAPDAQGRVGVTGERLLNGKKDFARIRLLPNGARDTSYADATDVPVTSPLLLENGLPDLSFPRTLTDREGATVAVSGVHRRPDGAVWTIRPLAKLTPVDILGITFHPEAQSVVSGRKALFAVGVGTRSPALYQWYFEGMPIPGATHAYLELDEVKASQAGRYRVLVIADEQRFISNEAMLTVIGGAARLTNFSARCMVAPNGTVITGFVIGNDGSPRDWLVRGLGQTLSRFGMSNFLSDTEIALWRDGMELQRDQGGATTTPIVEFAQRVGATPAFTPFPWLPSWQSRESALVRKLNAGSHTVHLRSLAGGSGQALFEVYDGIPGGASGSLRNVSLRARAGAAENTAIVGFVIAGNGPLRVLVRAVGPGLSRYGVTGALADPQLSVFPSFPSSPIVVNSGWNGDVTVASASEAVGAFPLATRDAAAVLRLEPGAYTLQTASVSGVTGEVLMEVYVLPE